MREIKYTISLDGVSPSNVQFGGMQGEHNATRLNVEISGDLLAKLEGAGYRFEAEDGAGCRQTIAMGESISESIICKVPQSVTCNGGNVTIRLIFSKVDETEIEYILYSFPMKLRFDLTSNGEITENKEASELSAAVSLAKDYAEQAKKFVGKDGISATHFWNGTVLTVTSGSGTTSADLKGEKGDSYILTDEDKHEIIELLEIDNCLDSGSTNPVQNKAVTEAVSEIFQELERQVTLDYVESSCVTTLFEQEFDDEQKQIARDNIDAVSKSELNATIADADPNCHAEYFTITDDGAISLKPEYRGASAGVKYTYATSDNGEGKDGSKNSELPENLVIPEVVNEIAVTTLRECIFMANKAIKSITIPTHITQLPALFAWCATSLEEVKGTEQIKSIDKSVLTGTAIRKAHFPNLETMNGGAQFSNCALLVSADLGKITEIPQKTFQFCDNLSAIHNTDGVISVGDWAFMKTNRLKNLTFLSNLTSVGNKAFLYSRVDNDWWDEKYNNTTFGSMATVRQLYTEKWWEGCTYTPCDTPMLSVFDQSNPEWRDNYINNYGHTEGTAYKYSNGCGVVSAAMAYSALEGKEFVKPSEFIEAVANAGGDMGANPRQSKTIQQYFDVLGYIIKDNLSYNGTSDEGKNLQIMYNALANGALVLAIVDGSYASDRATHMVVIHGINANGEVLVQDPTSSAVAYLGLDSTASYAIPIQNIVGNAALSEGFMIVYPKTVEI